MSRTRGQELGSPPSLSAWHDRQTDRREEEHGACSREASGLQRPGRRRGPGSGRPEFSALAAGVRMRFWGPASPALNSLHSRTAGHSQADADARPGQARAWDTARGWAPQRVGDPSGGPGEWPHPARGDPGSPAGLRASRGLAAAGDRIASGHKANEASRRAVIYSRRMKSWPRR